MQLYILRPRGGLPVDDDPWEPWYDKAFGFVICAASEAEARALAQSNGGDEVYAKDGISPWTDANYSTCEVLKPSATSRIVLRDFQSA